MRHCGLPAISHWTAVPGTRAALPAIPSWTSSAAALCGSHRQRAHCVRAALGWAHHRLAAALDSECATSAAGYCCPDFRLPALPLAYNRLYYAHRVADHCVCEGLLGSGSGMRLDCWLLDPHKLSCTEHRPSSGQCAALLDTHTSRIALCRQAEVSVDSTSTSRQIQSPARAERGTCNWHASSAGRLPIRVRLAIRGVLSLWRSHRTAQRRRLRSSLPVSIKGDRG